MAGYNTRDIGKVVEEIPPIFSKYERRITERAAIYNENYAAIICDKKASLSKELLKSLLSHLEKDEFDTAKFSENSIEAQIDEVTRRVFLFWAQKYADNDKNENSLEDFAQICFGKTTAAYTEQVEAAYLFCAVLHFAEKYLLNIWLAKIEDRASNFENLKQQFDFLRYKYLFVSKSDWTNTSIARRFGYEYISLIQSDIRCIINYFAENFLKHRADERLTQESMHGQLDYEFKGKRLIYDKEIIGRIGRRIKAYREGRWNFGEPVPIQYTLAELAAKLEISPQYLSKIENGKVDSINIDLLKKLADKTLTIHYFLADGEDKRVVDSEGKTSIYMKGV